jgi:hypothetical protein
VQYQRVLRQANTSSLDISLFKTFFLVIKIFNAHSNSLTLFLMFFAMISKNSKSKFSDFANIFDCKIAILVSKSGA